MSRNSTCLPEVLAVAFFNAYHFRESFAYNLALGIYPNLTECDKLLLRQESGAVETLDEAWALVRKARRWNLATALPSGEGNWLALTRN